MMEAFAVVVLALAVIGAAEVVKTIFELIGMFCDWLGIGG